MLLHNIEQVCLFSNKVVKLKVVHHLLHSLLSGYLIRTSSQWLIVVSLLAWFQRRQSFKLYTLGYWLPLEIVQRVDCWYFYPPVSLLHSLSYQARVISCYNNVLVAIFNIGITERYLAFLSIFLYKFLRLLCTLLQSSLHESILLNKTLVVSVALVLHTQHLLQHGLLQHLLMSQHCLIVVNEQRLLLKLRCGVQERVLNYTLVRPLLI